jgi:hypothetical protein
MTQPHIIAVGAELPPLAVGPKAKARKAPMRRGNRRSPCGRFQCINAFLDYTMRHLTGAERAVWLLLWRDTKPEGLAKTSQTSLAARAGMTDRAARKAVKGLACKGLLTVVHRGGLRQGPSVYRVHPLPREKDNRNPRSGC